jgi:beta-glucanase (GH16 family)
LISNKYFAVGQGITLTVRAKLNEPLPAGIVGGIFFYLPHAKANKSNHDEIDFELLSNDPNHVWTNIYANEPLGTGNPISYSYPSGSATDFHTYQMQWTPDKVSWYVDGNLIRTDTIQSTIPMGPMYVHLNIWVPESDFTTAYNPDLHWANSPSGNQTFSMIVDSVTVQ